jgi:hypothetical protein
MEAGVEGIAILGAAVIAYLQEIAKSKRFTEEQRQAARTALSEAFHATEGYYFGLDAGGLKNPAEQHRIAHLWEQAAICIEPFSRPIANRLGLKSQYWQQGATWSDAQIAAAKIQLDAVRRDGRFALIRRNGA